MQCLSALRPGRRGTEHPREALLALPEKWSEGGAWGVVRVVLRVRPTGRGGEGGMRATKVCVPKMGLSCLAVDSTFHFSRGEKFSGSGWGGWVWPGGVGGSTRSPPPPPGQRHGQQPVSGTADPGVVKQDKSSGGSIDTTKTRSGPQRVRMSSGKRPMGAAKGKQSDTEALCQPPPPPSRGCGPVKCVAQTHTPRLVLNFFSREQEGQPPSPPRPK